MGWFMGEWFITIPIIVVVAVIIFSWIRGSDWIEEWWHITILVVLALVFSLVWRAWPSTPTINMTSIVGEGTLNWYLVSIITAAVCILAYRWLRGDEPPIWVTVTAICVPLFLWGCWLIQPEWYLEWRHSGYFLWTILVVGALGWLADNEEGAVARVAKIGLFLLLLIATGIGAYGKWPKMDIPLVAAATDVTRRGSARSISNLSADVALPVIAQCESGGRQFDEDGNLIRNPESSAIGKYQIMASLHEKRAESLGFDIRTEEGNEGYARHLYQESGTQHWEADQRSKGCWGPVLRILARGHKPLKGFEVTMRREWTENIPFPTRGETRVDWMPKSLVTYQVMTSDGKITTFRGVESKDVSSRLSPGVRFRVLDADSAVINIVPSKTG